MLPGIQLFGNYQYFPYLQVHCAENHWNVFRDSWDVSVLCSNIYRIVSLVLVSSLAVYSFGVWGPHSRNRIKVCHKDDSYYNCHYPHPQPHHLPSHFLMYPATLLTASLVCPSARFGGLSPSALPSSVPGWRRRLHRRPLRCYRSAAPSRRPPSPWFGCLQAAAWDVGARRSIWGSKF